MSGSLGEAVLTLNADESKLDAAMANSRGKVTSAIGSMKRDFSSLGSSLAGIGSSISTTISRVSSTLTSVGSTITRNVTVPMAALGVGLIALGVNALKTGADFEKAMSGVQAILGATNEELQQLKDLAMNLGLDPNLIVSASQAAGVMEELAKNGLTTQQIMDGAARSAIALANATGTDFSTAAAIASTAMQLFNLTAEEMASIVNNITGVANSSRFSVEDFAQAMAMGGGVAAAMGIPIEDFATAIAGLSTSFSSGSDAGTSFKVFLQRLAPDTVPAIEAMKELGIITEEDGNRFFDAEGNMKSLSEIAGILQEAFKDLSDEQKILALTNIFGTDAMRAANAMAELGAEGFDKLSDSMAKTDAAANAATRMDNLAGAVEILTGIVEYFKLKFTDAFGPSVRMVVETFSKFLSEHSGQIDAMFIVLSEVFGGFAEKISAGINEHGPAVLDFFAKAIVALPIVIEKLSEMGSVAAPYVQKLFDAFTKITPDQIAKIMETLLGLAAAGPALMALGAALTPILIGLGVMLVQTIIKNGPAIQEFFKNLSDKLPDLVGKLKEIGSVAGPQVQKLVDAFMKMKPETIVSLIELIGALVIFSKVAGVLGSIGMFFSGLAQIGTILSGLSGVASLLGTLGSVFASIGAVITGGVLLPLLVIIGTLALVYLAFKTNFGGIRTTAEQLGFIIGYTFKKIGDDIKFSWDVTVWYLKDKFNEMLASATDLVTKIKGAFNIDWSELGKKIIDGMIAGMMGGIAAVISAAEDVAKAALDAAKNALGIKSPSAAFAALGDFSGMGFVQGLQKSMTPQKISPIMNRVVAGASSTISRSMNNNITINNPTAEPASSSVDGTLKRLGYLGVLK